MLKNIKKQNETSGRGRLWGPALGVVKTLHTDNKQHKENMKTQAPLIASTDGSLIERANNDLYKSAHLINRRQELEGWARTLCTRRTQPPPLSAIPPPTPTVHRPPPGRYISIHSHDVSFLIITEKILEINNRGDSTIKEEDEEKNQKICPQTENRQTSGEQFKN